MRIVRNLEYNRTILALNYFDIGFTRRGLAGTILRAFGEPSDLRVVVAFHALSAIFLAAPLALLTVRLVGRGACPAIPALLVLVVSPQLFWAWSSDVGRTDMLVCGLLAWSTIAVSAGRLTIAIALLSAGALVHEAAVLYGVPLVAALAWDAVRSKRLAHKTVIGAAALLGVTMAAVVFADVALAPTGNAIASNLAARIPQSYARDVAIYAVSTGGRGFATFLCRNLELNNHYWPSIALSGVYLVAYAAILGFRTRRDLLRLGVAVFCPFAVLSACTSDTGRWLSLAVMTSWLLAVGLMLARDTELRPLGGRLAAIAMLVAFCAMGPASYAYPARHAVELSTSMGFGPPPKWEGWVEKCDPRWRETIGLAASAN